MTTAVHPDPPSHTAAMLAVLRVASRYDDLLSREPFDELAGALQPDVGFARLAIFLREKAGHRLHASSRGEKLEPLPFPSIVLAEHHPFFEVLEANEPFVCDDTRSGHSLHEELTRAGLGSYAAMPIRTAGAPAGDVCGTLVVFFREPKAASRAPLDLLRDVASVVGASVARSLDRVRDRRLAMILETSSDALLAWDRSGRVTDANAAAARLTGIPRDELIGTTIGDLLLPIDPAAGRAPHTGRMLLARRGADEPLVVAVTVSSVSGDPLVAAHALCRNVSHVVVAERDASVHLARVRELEAELRTLLDNAPLIIFRLDPSTGDLKYLNRHAERLLGVPLPEALATPTFLRAAHVEPAGVEAFDGAIALARRGVVSPPYEARLRYRDGPEIVARGTVYPLLSETGQVVAIEGLLADVSAEQAARTRLVQADRLLSLGMLAAGVAHEINNPAAFILLGLDMLDRILGSREGGAATQAKDLVAELRDSIRRIVDIARDLRLFASPASPESGRNTVVDVNRTVESALTLTRGQIIERAQIVRRLEDVPPVLMDDGRLGQVIVNLLVNAAQAIPKTLPRPGRHLAPSAARADEPEGGPTPPGTTDMFTNEVVVATRSDGRVVEISVTDTGVGIPEEHLSRIWTPFFTTKGPDVGTGLGLSISREIVERAGGTMRVESPVMVGPDGTPRGARFVISLPAAGRGECVTPVSSPLPQVPTQRLRLLVVEDEVPLARALAEELGVVHDIDVVHRAEAALARLAERRYDVVLCDLRMPGMSGEALYLRVAEDDPEQARAFVFMTGAGFGADVERFFAAAGRPVLEKPFSAERALLTITKVQRANASGSSAQPAPDHEAVSR